MLLSGNAIFNFFLFFNSLAAAFKREKRKVSASNCQHGKQHVCSDETARFSNGINYYSRNYAAEGVTGKSVLCVHITFGNIRAVVIQRVIARGYRMKKQKKHYDRQGQRKFLF